jgi:hypothetical protein
VQRETITLKEVLAFMDTGAPFAIAFVTADKKRKKGGEWIEVDNCSKHEFVTSREKARMEKAQPTTEWSRNPNHFQNSTRNLMLQNSLIRKVHIRLLRRFNGKTIL